jgi:hypothetical protein
VVDAHDGGDVAVEFDTEPFGETTTSPISACDGRRRNLCRFAGAPVHEHADALATRVCGLSAGVVYADVACEH